MNDQNGQSLLRGNATAIESEVRRLDDLRDQLWSTGQAIRRLPAEGWEGSARDSFDEFRRAIADRWLSAGDLHDEAARALERYHDTLLDLRGRVTTADSSGMDPADLARLQTQLDAEAGAAATALRWAAHGLATLPRLPAEPVTVAAVEPILDVNSGIDPRTAHTSPAQFRERVRSLTEQVLRATFVLMPPG